MESIRTSMKAEAESLKNLVDEVSSENIEHTHIKEKTLLNMLKSQETTYDDYIAYLGEMSDEFQQQLYLENQKILFSKTLKIKTIPETTKPVPPVFTAGQFSKHDVAKLPGRVNVPNAEPKKRKIQFMEAVREYSVPGVVNAFHVSLDKSDRLWVSDWSGNLVQTDLHGNRLQNIETSHGHGYHTTTQDGDLIYTDSDKNVIYSIISDKRITEFRKTGDWTPLSVHSSSINGDILVGMIKDKEAKVTRHSKTGKKKYRTYKGTTKDRNCIVVHTTSQKMTVDSIILSSQQSITYPRGVCVDDENNLHVEQHYTNTVSVYKYLQ
uniref:Uncharacterized protein LOC111132738 n=1 Tax=Crassostrea virginica TaxID=6565 RepID=A0A8B8E9D1_CRAVI|nr:uncharacterized protein LOC111132738 [Crassostrea virginica]